MSGTVGTYSKSSVAGIEREFEILCDDNGSFLRRYSIDNAGVVVINDTTLNGTTAYTPVGTPKNCGASSDDLEIFVLCDDNGSFLRHLTRDADGNVVIANTTLDGATAYTPVGAEHLCISTQDALTDECFIAIVAGVGYASGDRLTRLTTWDMSVNPPVFKATVWHNLTTDTTLAAAPTATHLRSCVVDTEYVVLCDTTNKFIRHISVDNSGGTTIVDTTLDGTTPYVTIGTVDICKACCDDNEVLTLCDDNGTFLRTLVYKSDGTVTINDTTLDGTTAYTTVGTVTNCNAPSIILERCYQDGGTPALCTEDSYPRVLWEDSTTWNAANPSWPTVEAQLLAATPTTFTNTQNSGVDTTLTLTGGVTGIGPDTAADSLLMTVPDGATATLAHSFSQSACLVFSIRVYDSAPLTITSDAVIHVSHNTSNPAIQGDVPVITNNDTTSVTITSPTNSRTLYQISATQQVTISVVNNRGVQLDHFIGMHLGAQSAGTGGTIYKVYDYSNGTQLIINTTDPDDRPTAIDTTWSIIACSDAVTASMDTEIVTLCDDNGSFLRHIVHDTEGSVKRIYDTTLDGTTSYTVVGTVKNCATSSITETFVCANGVTLLRRSTIGVTGTESLVFYGDDGLVVASPLVYKFGQCKKSICLTCDDEIYDAMSDSDKKLFSDRKLYHLPEGISRFDVLFINAIKELNNKLERIVNGK